MLFDLAKAQKLAETAVTLKNEFLKTANWRREQAIDYPDDKWNFEAVALLDRLANTVDEIDPRLLEAYAGFWEGDGLSGAETQSEMLRGFVQFCPVVSNFVHEPSAAARSTPAIYRRVGWERLNVKRVFLALEVKEQPMIWSIMLTVAAVFCIALTKRGRPNAPALRKA